MGTYKTPIRTAIVGFGVAGSVFHAPLIEAAPDYRLEAIVTGNASRMAQARARYPHVRIIESFEDLLASMDDQRLSLDLLVLATPPSRHRLQAEALIQRGKALVIDKPFAPSVADGLAIVGAAQQAGTPLSVFQNRRFDGDFLTLSRLLETGELGSIRSFESRFTWWMPQGFGNWRDTAPASQGGGLLFDLGTHLIDQAIRLFGPVESVHAELDRHTGGPGTDEDTFVSLRHRDGVRSRLWMNGLAPLAGPRFHLVGSRSGFLKYGLDSQEAALSKGMSPLDEAYGIDDGQAFMGAGTDHARVDIDRGDYPAFYRQLASAMIANGDIPVLPREAIDTLKVIESIHRRFPIRSA